MEKIKQQVSDLAHNLVTIVMITLFLFPVQPANALKVKPLVKTEAQLKQEVLDSFSKEIYKPSEMLLMEDRLHITGIRKLETIPTEYSR